MKKYIMALDQGTTSSRCILFDENGETAAIAQKEFTQFYPKPGWVEHDPMEIWGSQMGVAQEVIQKSGISYREIVAIGITNQRETTIVWDRLTGKPIYNAIVWQCRRTADDCAALIARGLSETIRRKTGLLPDAYFSATKIRWILDHVDGARKRAEKGELLFGTIDSWLIWNMTKGKVHATDFSNASRTMLFHLTERKWDTEILAELGIPAAMLPEVKNSDACFGETDPSLFGGSIPIHAAIGDQQSALFGHGCLQPGNAKNTYGTGGFLLMNTGGKPVISAHRLLTTIAWCRNGKVQYALEGSVFIAGAAIQWLRDEWKVLENAAQSEELAGKVADTNGVYVVPSFVGLGAPYWEPKARGMIVGLTRGANRNHLVRATLESLAYQTCDVLRAMEEDSGIALKQIKVDGGAAANRFLLQFQADITGVPVAHPENSEITAYGAALMAGQAAGFFPEKERPDLSLYHAEVFTPEMEQKQREKLLTGWKKAVACALFYAKETEEETE